MIYYSDTSEFQVPVNDTYPHRIICVRSNDGTYRDKVFAKNLAWCKRAADDGRIDAFIVYMVYRPNSDDTFETHRAVVGDPHPKMIAMVDVEAWGGQIRGDNSDSINMLIVHLAGWLGSRQRVIAYLNCNESGHLWPRRPSKMRYVVPSYGADPYFPPGFDDVRANMIAHQYTDEKAFAGGPSGAAPFGRCDMNKSQLTSTEFAAACGVEEGFLMAIDEARQEQMWSGAAQSDGPAPATREPAKWLQGFLPRSFGAWRSEKDSGGYDPKTKRWIGPWVRDQITAIVNEVVTGVFDLVTPIDFGDGKVYKPQDVPVSQPVNFVTLLRVIAARQAVAQGYMDKTK